MNMMLLARRWRYIDATGIAYSNTGPTLPTASPVFGVTRSFHSDKTSRSPHSCRLILSAIASADKLVSH